MCQERAERGWKNRLEGERFEFKVLRYFKKTELIAIRSAGSHSLADIVVITKKGETWLVSCKKNSYQTPEERKEIEKMKKKLPNHTKFKLVFDDGKNLFLKDL